MAVVPGASGGLQRLGRRLSIDALPTKECESTEQPFSLLPKEIILNILGHLDGISLCRVAQLSTRWKDLADDDILWRGICQWHGYGRKRCDTRLWKVVYRDRMDIERNWRCGRYTTQTLTHTKGIFCLQFNETLSDPSFPVLISGSLDSTIQVWNMDTGVELYRLTGHRLAVRALQFDESKLITGSWDYTLKIWDWRHGKCIRTLTGHSNGVTCLNYDESLLASGSKDSTIKIWDLSTAELVFTLEGHSDWVTSVSLFDNNSRAPSDASNPIKPGMLLFSASYDTRVRLWDLNARACLRQFFGHTGSVLTMTLFPDGDHERDEEKTPQNERRLSAMKPLVPAWQKLVLISGSLDGTFKFWDIKTGKVISTNSEHHEGIAAVAGDKMRIVTGGYTNVKVWSRDSQECLTTLPGHGNVVTCVALTEDKVVSGSLDRTIKIWSFRPKSERSE